MERLETMERNTGSPARHRRGGAGDAIAVIAEARYLAQREPSALIGALRRRGVEPRVVDPAALGALEALAGVRVAVARGRSRCCSTSSPRSRRAASRP